MEVFVGLFANVHQPASNKAMRSLGIVALFATVLLTSCNLLFSGNEDAIPAELRGISQADALVLTGDGSTRSAREIDSDSGLIGIDADGNELQLTFTNENGDALDYQVSYAFRPTADHLIAVRSEMSSGADIQLQAGVILIELATEKVFSLTPPLVQEALDYVAEEPRVRRAYGQLGFGGWRSEGLANGDFWPWGSGVPDWQRLVFVDADGNLFYQMASEMIVDNDREGGTNPYGDGDWLYSEELLYVDMTNYTQQLLYSASGNVGGGWLEGGLSGYFMDRDGTQYYSVRISDTQSVHYRVDSAGSREVIDNAPEIYGKRFFHDNSGQTLFLNSGLNWSSWSVDSLQSDGSSQLIVSLPDRALADYAVPEDIVVGNKRYFLGFTSYPVLYEYFTDGVAGEDTSPIELSSLETIVSVASVGDVVYLIGRLTDGSSTLLRIPTDSEAVETVSLPEYIPTGLTASGSEVLVGVFSVADVKNGIIPVQADGTVGAFSAFSFGGSTSEPLPLIPLN
jgi:hypothetical protein